MKKNIFYKSMLLVVLAIFITACPTPTSSGVVDTSLTIEDVLALIDANYAHESEKAEIIAIKTLLETGNVNAKNSSQRNLTSLMYASSNGYVDIVKALLDVKGIDINALDSFDDSALTFAIKWSTNPEVDKIKLIEAIEVLLKEGADQNISNPTALVRLEEMNGYAEESVYNAIKALLDQYQ